MTPEEKGELELRRLLSPDLPSAEEIQDMVALVRQIRIDAFEEVARDVEGIGDDVMSGNDCAAVARSFIVSERRKP